MRGSQLFGHEAQVAAFRAGLASGCLHHAWLLAGTRGVGKATFAHLAARYLLATAAGAKPAGDGLAVPSRHPAAALLNAHSHPDFRLLDRLPRDPKRRDLPRVEWNDDEELARNINVDQVRRLKTLFASTPSQSPWRVVVVDSIDDLEPPAANALLKSLEEPPANCLFLLVSHAPAGLLPTIRSRCLTVRFNALGDDAMTLALRGLYPGADQSEISEMLGSGEGSPGLAVQRRGLAVADLDADMHRLAQGGDPHNRIRSALASKLALKAAQPRYELFLGRVVRHIAAATRTRRGDALAHALGLYVRARDLASDAIPLSLDPAAVTFELAGLLAGLAPSGAGGPKRRDG